jgi:hypothetical protein
MSVAPLDLKRSMNRWAGFGVKDRCISDRTLTHISAHNFHSFAPVVSCAIYRPPHEFGGGHLQSDSHAKYMLQQE